MAPTPTLLALALAVVPWSLRERLAAALIRRPMDEAAGHRATDARIRDLEAASKHFQQLSDDLASALSEVRMLREDEAAERQRLAHDLETAVGRTHVARRRLVFSGTVPDAGGVAQYEVNTGEDAADRSAIVDAQTSSPLRAWRALRLVDDLRDQLARAIAAHERDVAELLGALSAAVGPIERLRDARRAAGRYDVGHGDDCPHSHCGTDPGYACSPDDCDATDDAAACDASVCFGAAWEDLGGAAAALDVVLASWPVWLLRRYQSDAGEDVAQPLRGIGGSEALADGPVAGVGFMGGGGGAGI